MSCAPSTNEGCAPEGGRNRFILRLLDVPSPLVATATPATPLGRGQRVGVTPHTHSDAAKAAGAMREDHGGKEVSK